MTSSNFSIFLVVTPIYTTTVTKFLVNLKSRNAGSWANLYDLALGTGDGTTGGGNGSYIRTDTSLVGANASYYTVNTPVLTNCEIVGTTVNFYRNGSNYTTGSVSLSMVSTDVYQVFTMGAYLNTDAFDTVSKQGCKAHFHEVLVYNGSLTATERRQVENYLISKWNISAKSLPLTHPYRKISPI